MRADIEVDDAELVPVGGREVGCGERGALRHRDLMGEGQYVDVALYDAMVAMADAGINYWSMGIENALVVPTINHAFKASDGYFVMMCGRLMRRAHARRSIASTSGHRYQ